MNHSPSLVGRDREIAEDVAYSAGFFAWAVGRHRALGGIQIGSAIDAKLATWQPAGSKPN
jgi:hypothetical protein